MQRRQTNKAKIMQPRTLGAGFAVQQLVTVASPDPELPEFMVRPLYRECHYKESKLVLCKHVCPPEGSAFTDPSSSRPIPSLPGLWA